MRPIQHLEAQSQELAAHGAYRRLESIDAIRVFMEAHVFAVWDFMSLLKRLQRDLTCVDLPWVPRRDSVAARLINEIVLGEESDLTPGGEPMSHLDLYLAAMREIGADTTEFERFLELVANGVDAGDAMVACGAPPHVRAFVGHTLDVVTRQSTLSVMASFFHGRENVIPRMFSSLLQRWNIAERQAPMFVYYLKRHIEVDGESHGPMAQKIIERAMGDDPILYHLVVHSAIESMKARIALWDGVRASMRESEAA